MTSVLSAPVGDVRPPEPATEKSVAGRPPAASRPGRLRMMVAGAAVGAAVAGGVAYSLAGGSAGGAGGLAASSLPTVVVTAHHSRFTPERIAVEAGTKVRFVVRNADPITHELIVGPPAVHERHERGTEAAHGAVPGEVTVGPDEEAATTYVFDRPGTIAFGCHLPGHWDYGMHGKIEVR